MSIRRTLTEMLIGSSGWPRRARREPDSSCQNTPLTSESAQFWQRDPKSNSPWWFSPPSRWNGYVTYYFYNHNDVDYPCVQPVLKILDEKFNARIQSHFSPYNAPYTIFVDGFTIDLVQDNCPCPSMTIAECDDLFFEDLINRLQTELNATD